MARFYIDAKKIHNGEVALGADDARHAATVLRLKDGAVVELLDGAGASYRGVIARISKEGVVVMVGPENKRIAPGSTRIAIAAAVIKPEPMDLLVQKCCELGVSDIYPLVTERTVVRLAPERWLTKVSRWQRIVQESCKQCGLTAVPVVHPVDLYKHAVQANFSGFKRILIPTLSREAGALYEALIREKLEDTLILIGPEGDFTREEVDLAVSKGAVPVSLGPLVLRSETAALYALSVVNFFIREVQKK